MRKKLDAKAVQEIRILYAHNVSKSDLAARFGRSWTNIHHIITNEIYFDPGYTPPMKREFDTSYGLELRKRGMTFREIRLMEAKKHHRERPYSFERVRQTIRTAEKEQQ